MTKSGHHLNKVIAINWEFTTGTILAFRVTVP
jgi:hypothetical protein